jgi:protein SCO1/2
MTRLQRFTIGALVSLLLMVGGFSAWRLFGAPPPLHGVLLDSTTPAADFTLTAAEGRQVSLRDFRGKIVLLYFGYTFCPDVCPATLAEVRIALEALGTEADDVQLIMVSVDPERDTPERLAQYVQRFNPTFLGVTGSIAEVEEAAIPFGITFRKEAGSAATGYLVSHSAHLLALDRNGQTRMTIPFGVTGEELASDLRYLLRL